MLTIARITFYVMQAMVHQKKSASLNNNDGKSYLFVNEKEMLKVKANNGICL